MGQGQWIVIVNTVQLKENLKHTYCIVPISSPLIVPSPTSSTVTIMKPTITALLLSFLLFPAVDAYAEFQAGAAIVDVTPINFPVIVNGGMLSGSASQVKTRLNARAIVLDDGAERLAIVVVDSCMVPRPLLDDAKNLASQRTKIRPDRMLISATHTHTAPASMGCLGTEADPVYGPFLREKLAEAIAAAEANLEPARVGWAVENAAEYTALRRWILRTDRIGTDPFGNRTVRAGMHWGSNWDQVTGESGPEDPDLSLISFQATDGRPIAILANFSMHYFSDGPGLSADYFGLFCEGLQSRLGRDEPGKPPFVALMSHGCSGDIWRRDYTVPADAAREFTIENYSEGLLMLALGACETIDYQANVDLAMSEARFTLKYRVPDQQRLEWARSIVKAMGDRLPKNTREVYARAQVLLDQRQETEIVVQALRIGDIGITTTPCETYALTGLKLKLQSPLAKTMVIELANGGDGYIPPPEQHWLGGYNTWAARSAGLEVQAEPKITETALALLEMVAGRPRRQFLQSRGPASEAIMRASPVAYWRLDEFSGPRAVDRSGQFHDAVYENGVAFFLAGPRSEDFCTAGEENRAVHFASGRLRARIPNLKDQYSVSLYFWNGMPNDAREVTGWMFSRSYDHGLSRAGDHLGLGGTASEAGKLIYLHSSDKHAEPLVGRNLIDRWSWNHIVFVRDRENVRIYLNGNPEPEIHATSSIDVPDSLDQFFFGGRSDNQANWEGRLDEIAVFARALSSEDVAHLGSW